MTDICKGKFFKEVGRQLIRAEINIGKLENGSIPVMLDDKPVCHVVSGQEGVLIFTDDSATPAARDLAHRAKQISHTVREYVLAMESAPPLESKYKGLDDKWRLLADYNNAAFTGMLHEYGYQFATFAVDRDGDLRDGDYYTDFGCGYDDHYGKSKESFAVRAGLVDDNKLFSEQQLTDLRTILTEYKDIGESVNDSVVDNLLDKISELLPSDADETQGETQGISL